MAEVQTIYLPPGEDGTKQGVDDYLAAGNSVNDLLSLATPDLLEPPSGEGDEAPYVPYRETPHGLVWERPTREGPIDTPLTNFNARIVGDDVEDDGAEQRRSFEIEADLRGRRSSFSVQAERFLGMGWPSEHLGATAIVYPGFGTKDHARAAIQMRSGDVPLRYRYAHTGWREIGDDWAYLHAGGAIGPKGSLEDVNVAISDGRLGDYELLVPPTGDHLARAVEASLRILELAPLTITVPLLAAVYRAPLNEAVPVDLSMFLSGPTGAFKTELSAVAQAHYGARFSGRNLPGNWSSTENTLEKQAFALKDAVFTVDDFAPNGTTSDVARLHSRADRLLRGQGNRSGRGRMRPDGSLRPTYHPRGIIVSSGEDVPRGQSLRARMLVTELSPGDVDLGVLTEMQRAGTEGLLAGTMSGYVAWVAARMDGLKGQLVERQRYLRSSAAGSGAHARTPETVASLFLGLETFFRFALEVGVITEPRADELREEAWRALGEAASAQVEHQATEEPTRQFAELLVAALAGGDAHVADVASGEEPCEASHWGWRPNVDGDPIPRGRRIGWLAEDGSVYLEPGVSFAVAQDMARKQGTSLPIGQRTLWKRMAEKGLLSSRDTGRGRNTARATVNGKRMNVIHLAAGVLSSNGPFGPDGPPPGPRGRSGPEVGAVSDEGGKGSARRNGPERSQNLSTGPKGPMGPVSGEGPAQGVGRGSRPATPDYLPGGGPNLISTRAGLEELLTELRGSGRVALDLETTGLDPREDRVRLLTLATERGAWIVDCFGVDASPLLPVLAEKELVIHNAAFDLGFLVRMGFEMSENVRVFDTMLSSQLLGDDHSEDDGEDA